MADRSRVHVRLLCTMAKADPIRILLADDHALLREELRVDLESQGLVVCCEAEDGPGAVAAALRERPDVCLLDVQMPGGGVEAAAEISARLPETRIVMLTGSRDDEVALASVRAGAVGYLLKGVMRDTVADALRAVAAGDVHFPRPLLVRIASEVGPRAGSDEAEVLELLQDGLSSHDVAARLSVPLATVRAHTERLLAELRSPRAVRVRPAR